MIKFNIGGRYLRLAPDTNIKFSLIFPDPTTDGLPNSTINWFSVPFCDDNDSIFKFARYIEVSNKLRIYDCIFSTGLISMKGIMIVTEITGFYKCSFTDYPFPQGFKEKLLPNIEFADIPMGNTPENILAWAQIYSRREFPDSDIAFPTAYCPQWYSEDTNPTFDKFVNAFISNEYVNPTSPVLQYVNNVMDHESHHNYQSLLPMPYLSAAITRIFESIDFAVGGTVLADADVKKIVLFNNTPIDKNRKNKYYVAAYTTQGIEKIINAPPSSGIMDEDTVSIRFDTEEDSDNCFILEDLLFYHLHSIYSSPGGLVPLQIELDVIIEPEEIVGNILFGVNPHRDSILQPMVFEYFSENEIEPGNWQRIKMELEFPSILFEPPVSKTYHIGMFPQFGTLRYKNAVLRINPVSYNSINIFDSVVNIKNHLPNISVSDFVNNAVKILGAAVFTDAAGKKVSFEFWNDILDSTEYYDLSDKTVNDTDEVVFEDKVYALKQTFSEDEAKIADDPQAQGTLSSNSLGSVEYLGIIRYVKNINAWLIGTRNETDFTWFWKKYSDNFKNIIPEAWNSEIELAFRSMKSDVFDDLQFHSSQFSTLPHSGLASPVYDGAANSKAYGEVSEPIDAKLLFYHGFKADRLGNTYPLASSDRYDNSGTVLTSFALRLNGADGIYEKLLKRVYEYMRRDTLRINLHIEESDLPEILSLYSVNPPKNRRKVRVGNANYLPMQFDFEIDMNDGILNCQATLR